MSAAIYSRLLDEFRQGAVESGDLLFSLEIRSPGHFSKGVPGIPDTVNYEKEQVIASVNLPFDAGCEDSTEAVALIKKRGDKSSSHLPPKELIDKFKTLCSEAGATLRLHIRDRLTDQHSLDRNQARWWIGLLCRLQGFTVYNAEGVYLEQQVILNPWEDSRDAIELLKLNTDSPCWPGEESKSHAEPNGQKPSGGSGADDGQSNCKAKRSTEQGEARLKIIAALTAHHKYENGSCLNWEPIVGNHLARSANVGSASVSRFFTEQFGGRTKYRAACVDKTRLIVALKVFNDELTPKILFGARSDDVAEAD